MKKNILVVLCALAVTATAVGVVENKNKIGVSNQTNVPVIAQVSVIRNKKIKAAVGGNIIYQHGATAIECPELYWFSPEGKGFSSTEPTKSSDVLMHGMPNRISFKIPNQKRPLIVNLPAQHEGPFSITIQKNGNKFEAVTPKIHSTFNAQETAIEEVKNVFNESAVQKTK